MKEITYRLTAWTSFQLYRWFLLPWIVFFLKCLTPLLPAKIQEMILDRKNSAWPKMPAQPVWIHASSGEIEYAKPLIRAIKEKWPQQIILVSYFSPSAKKLLKQTPGIDAVVPLPWDERKIVKKFLDHFNPKCLLIARTDIWPEFTFQCKMKNIPSFVFSATFSDSRAKMFFLTKTLSRFCFDQLTAIFCASEEDLIEINKTDIISPRQVLGDTRYDQVIWRAKNPSSFDKMNKLKSKMTMDKKVTLIIGSSWPEDEEKIFPALSSFIKKGGQVILAPHEINENSLYNTRAQLKKNGLRGLIMSKDLDAWCEQKDHQQLLIVDQVGVLAEVYTLGDIAFVGGSFRSKVHSVMEPLAAGLPTLVGPFHLNNREALLFQDFFFHTSERGYLPPRSSNNLSLSDLSEPPRFLLVPASLPMVKVIKLTEDIYESLFMMFKLSEQINFIKNQIQGKIRERSGATQKVIAHLTQILKQPDENS